MIIKKNCVDNISTFVIIGIGRDFKYNAEEIDSKTKCGNVWGFCKMVIKKQIWLCGVNKSIQL